MTSLAVRRPRVKPARNITILARDPSGLTVRIVVGKESCLYRVERIPAEFGVAFTVAKLAQADDLGVEYKPPYHVNLDTDRRSCECKGHLRHGHCKHADGLLALQSRGKV